ncbi:hypothetical protein QYF36_021852 [Acer negundo]|nr:hypothetical protein QYF36_021852 [Acer negundo]
MQSMETTSWVEEFDVGEALIGDGVDERGGGARAKERHNEFCDGKRLRRSANRTPCLGLLNVVKCKRVVIDNYNDEKFVGILYEMGSKDFIIVCHGFQSWKERILMINIAGNLDRGRMLLKLRRLM